MKRLLLLIAVSIVWSGSVLQAQEYVPFVHKGACGDTYAYDPYVKDCNFGFYHHDPEDRYIWDIDVFAHYYITGEKAVNGKIYKQFVESKSCDYASGTEIALIREEDKKVYLLDGEKEWLWYDFTLEKGDTITI